MSDFLLELRCEEIPARMQKGARADLEKLFRAELASAGVTPGEITVWSTPRRLALIARGLPLATEAVSEEAKGPPEGAPDQAVDGFCRKNGVSRDQLELRDVKGRNTWFAVIEKPGRAVSEVLAEAIPAIIRAFPWPKSQRWGAASISTESLRWVRPLSGIVAILGDALVACEVDGVASGFATMGHRFHHSGDVTIAGAGDYAARLRAAYVIVDHEEREAIIRTRAAEVAAEAGLVLVEDEGLVVENAGLTEWPVPLLGRFEEDFLSVPPEVIQLTARTNQKYFICTNPLRAGLGEGDRSPQARGGGAPPSAADAAATSPSKLGEDFALANAFICTANIEPTDGGALIVDGNRKVLAARLADARFFWEQDRKISLADHARKLERITFHEKLGSVADKVERVAKLARWLVEQGIVTSSSSSLGEGDRSPQARGGGAPPSAADAAATSPSKLGEDRAELADLAEQAARLCKADLVTEMVGEFPELQGLMGGYYASAEGLPDEVADAIRDHYKPVGQGDDVPTAPVTVAVSLADKLDTLAMFFAINEKPTGSKDPFALRRAAIGAIQLITLNQLRVKLSRALRLSPMAMVVTETFFGEGKWAIDEQNLKFGDLEFRTDDIGIYHSRWDLEDGFVQLTGKPETAVKFENVSAEMILEMVELKVTPKNVLDFFADRLKVQQREAGVRHDLIDAVFALGGEDDLVRLLARVHALQAFMASEDGTNLLAGYKRAANILKKEDWRGIEGEIAQTGEEDPLAEVDDPDLKEVVAAKMAERHAKELSYTPEISEKALIDALASAEPRAAAAIAAEDFAAAMAALASLRGPIDGFFEDVTVNDENPAKRAARLDLLARFRAAVHNVADFSKIEG